MSKDRQTCAVHLVSAGGNKINVIKVVREITALGLKEAKDLVESAPCAVIDGVNYDEAEYLHAKLSEVGAVASIEVEDGAGDAEEAAKQKELLAEWKAIAAEWRSLYFAK